MRDTYPKVPVEEVMRQESSLVSLFAVREKFPDAEVYLVGGAVRDAALGRVCKDFDFVIRGVPEEELTEWMQAHGRVDFVGRVFGVYKFVPAGSALEIDIALPRTERAHPDSQGDYRAFTIETNAFLPIIEDLARRDFTINAMAYEINRGVLYDPFSGLKDLGERMLRAVGDPTHRFEEDLSRILRAVRFACELKMKIEGRTWEALKRLAPRIEDRLAPTAIADRLRRRPGAYVIPREAIGRELIKSLAADLPLTMELWRESGLFRAMAPSLHITLPSISSPAACLSSRCALAFLLAPVGRGGAGNFYDRFILSDIGSADSRYVSKEDLLLFVGVFEKMEREDPSLWRATDFASVFLISATEDLLGFLSMAVVHLPQEKREAYELVLGRIGDRRSRMIRALGLENVEDLPPLLAGEKLMAHVHLSGGPALGELIKKLRDAQLEGQVKTSEEAKEWLDRARLL